MTKTNLEIITHEGILLAIIGCIVAASTFLAIPPWTDKPADIVMTYRLGFAALAVLSGAFGALMHFLRRRETSSVIPPLAMLFFICVVMGMCMWLTLFDYGSNHMFFIYVSALVVVFGLIYLPPIITALVVLACTVIMMAALAAAGYDNPSLHLTLLAYGLLVTIVEACCYNARLRAAIAHEKVRNISIHDELTGAKNRRALEDDAALFVGQPLHLLLGDIDEFKFYNDLFGHAAGDTILRKLAESLEQAFGGEHLYRYGGDEFVIVVPGGDESTFLDAIDAWRSVPLEVEAGDEAYAPTTSGGYVVGTPLSEREFHEMLQLADIRLYDAKQAGRNTVLGSAYDEHSKASLAEYAERMRKRGVGDTDPLTGLPGLTYFLAHARTIIKSPKLAESSFNIVYFNVDNMKAYNERFGMAAGDKLLAFAARTIEESFEHTLLARSGDDRFVLLTRGDDLFDGLQHVYDQVLRFNDDSRTVIHAGVFPYSRQAEQVEINVACDRAKLACDQIKGHYNACYCLYDDSMVEARDSKQSILNRFEEALEKGHIQVYYQAIMRTDDAYATDFEALARWIDPDEGFISPGDFIPVLEEFRLIHRLDLHIVELVCADFRASTNAERPFAPVNVNLSRFDMELCDIVAETVSIMKRYDMPPHMLNIEITESAFTDNSGLLRDTIERFHGLGMQVWMDDFGSGYSSLNVLREYDFDVVKLDLLFLRFRNDTSRERSRTMLPHLINMIKDLGPQTLVEGVENERQHEFLKTIGCDMVQGFAFAKPMPIGALMNKVESGQMPVAMP